MKQQLRFQDLRQSFFLNHKLKLIKTKSFVLIFFNVTEKIFVLIFLFKYKFRKKNGTDISVNEYF